MATHVCVDLHWPSLPQLGVQTPATQVSFEDAQGFASEQAPVHMPSTHTVPDSHGAPVVPQFFVHLSATQEKPGAHRMADAPHAAPSPASAP